MYHKVLPFVFALCLTGVTLSAQEPEEGVEIEVLEETQTTEPIIRTPQSIPITCFYYPTFETVELSFLSDLGTADIVVSNLSTETVDYYQQVGIGVAVIPISDPGPIIILITTSSGHRYRACFVA